MRKSIWTVVCLMALLFTLCAASASEAQTQNGLTRITEDVYAYVDIKGSGPQNSYGSNAGIVIGRDGILVVDTLISAKQAQKFIKDIRAISHKPIKYVVNTHYHLDHTFGNCEFKKVGATIVSHFDDMINALKNNHNVLRDIKAYGLTEADMQGTSMVYPDLTFKDEVEIDLGYQRVRLIYPGPSHTDGSVLVYLPDKKVLFTGDILFTDFHPFMADGDIKSWEDVLDDIEDMDVETIIPGHGPISSKQDVKDMEKYISAFDKKARKLCKKSKDVEQIAAEMAKEMPPRSEGEWLIKANIQMKYVKD